LPPVLLFGVGPAIGAWFIVRPFIEPIPPLPALYTSVGFSVFALLATLYIIPAVGPAFIRANLKGIDLLKNDRTPM
jgi:UDP-N-acetylglucosamine--dolichyl-phosphate N-acetylglucosaminephosphotransferase